MEITTCDIVEMLKSAMMNEKQAAADYQCLQELAKPPGDRMQIMMIRKDELMHHDMLQEIYMDITGKEYIAGAVKQCSFNNYCEALRISICDELEAAESYSELACCLACMRHKEKVICILNDEKCHARKLYKMHSQCR